jgi:tRNA (guanine9-N1)-methyltransferase
VKVSDDAMRISLINDSCSRGMHADAADELSELDPKCAYIIGGIVDRNRYKGLCKTKAEAGGIRTARLPIGDYVKLLAAPVMTVNHVRRLLAY